MLAATWGGSNPTGWATFVILWVMRQSAKLNVFLGRAQPEPRTSCRTHLQYLQTYFQPRADERAVSGVGGGVELAGGAAVAGGDGSTASAPFDGHRADLRRRLVELAILEHGFMVLPLPSQALWQWGLRSRVDRSHPA